MKRILFMVLSIFLISTALPNFASASSASTVVSAGQKYIGVPYARAGTSSSGFDCSGFTQRAFSDAGISIPRTTGQQYNSGSPVAKGNLQAGDLVFFSSSGKGVSHSGIYIGSNNFIHSSSSKGVTISSINDPYYWGSRYIGARRIIGQTAAPEQPKTEEKEDTTTSPTTETEPEPETEPNPEPNPEQPSESVVIEENVVMKLVIEVPAVAKVAKVTTAANSSEIDQSDAAEEDSEELANQINFQHLHPTAIALRFTYLVRGEEIIPTLFDYDHLITLFIPENL